MISFVFKISDLGPATRKKVPTVVGTFFACNHLMHRTNV